MNFTFFLVNKKPLLFDKIIPQVVELFPQVRLEKK